MLCSTLSFIVLAVSLWTSSYMEAGAAESWTGLQQFPAWDIHYSTAQHPLARGQERDLLFWSPHCKSKWMCANIHTDAQIHTTNTHTLTHSQTTPDCASMSQLFYGSLDQRMDQLQKVKSMAIILLINSTLYSGSVFLGELYCLVINPIWELASHWISSSAVQ